MKYDFETFLDRTGKDSLAMEKIPFDNASVEAMQRLKEYVVI